MKTIFVIEIFERDSSSFVNQLELEKTDLQTMRRIFSVNQDDPYMYNSYKIDEAINEELYISAAVKVNIQRYDCYGGYRSP